MIFGVAQCPRDLKGRMTEHEDGLQDMNDDGSGVVCLADLRHHRMNLGEK
jgi:hypothetical protein